MCEEKIASITLQNIYKRNDPSDFTLRVKRLEFDSRGVHVIVGANGSGKSTFLKLLSGLTNKDQGSIVFNRTHRSRYNRDLRGIQKRIGFVMQNPYLFNTTVFENVALGLKIRGVSKRETSSRVNNTLKKMMIGHLSKRRSRYLSRGESQKVAIAQVLVFEPNVILMDEPTANIDRESTMLIEGLIKDLQRRDNSIVIITTHSLSQARRLSEKAISIREGEVCADVRGDYYPGDLDTLSRERVESI
ncbi:MAG: ABC transporter ATP-binding protein [Candidatus Omnitrophota bacterium]